MERAYLKRICFACMVLTVVFVLAWTPAHSATGTINSTVTIATPITITGDRDLNFGVFTAPTFPLLTPRANRGLIGDQW